MEEKVRILKMVEEGKIKAEEALKLLEALETPSEIKKRGKLLKIRVEEPEKTKVNITLPLGLLKIAKKFIPKEAKATINERDVDLDEIFKAVEEGLIGDIIDIEDEDGTVVKIWVE
jgi:DUF4097 and DUF4098 domain-containing protein YvlB